VRSTPNAQRVQLWFLVRDPLAQIVPPLDPDLDPGRLLIDGIPVAVAEDGTVWRLKIIGSHVLLFGRTGAGKSAVIWTLILGLAPLVRSGLVKLWVIDPKGGMELAAGRPLFDRFAYGDASTSLGYETALAELLEDAVAEMRRRADRLRGHTRLHTPTTVEPLIVVVIDELAALTAWITDRTMRKRIDSALSLLLSQGRAVGVVVVGALQDPRKDVIPQRDLFPIRVGLAVCEAEHVRLSLGTDAYNRGAHCELIPETMPGVAYVAVDGIPDPVRVRFAWHSDADIAQLTAPAVEGPVLTLVGDVA
jgi:S-DNA-T family DNA segregation ATPase FtsK/SpoIIIE